MTVPFFIRNKSYILSLVLILIGCSNVDLKSEEKNIHSSSSPKSSDEDQKLIEELLAMDPSVALSYISKSEQNGKKVTLCMYYKKAFSGPMTVANKNKFHHCDWAEFHVILNGETMPKILNLNNAVKRQVKGISGKEYSIGEFEGVERDSDIEQNGMSVPGTLFTGSWKDGKLVINTTCAIEEWCHTGLVSYSLIGEVTAKYKGRDLKLFFTAEESTIENSKEYSYEFSDFKLEQTKYRFGDFCELLH